MKIKDKILDFLDYLHQKDYAEKTINEYNRHFSGSLAHSSLYDKRLKDIHLTDMSALLEAGKSHGRFGPQRSLSVFRQYLKYLKESGEKFDLDYRDIKLPVIPSPPNEYLTLEELELIRNSLSNDMAGLRCRCLIEILLDTGMRISEAISLDKTDVDFEKKEALVTNCKTHEKEKVYFTDRSLFWISKYLEKRKDDLPCLFVSGRGRLLSVTSRNYMRTHLNNLGINKHIKHHIFRKTFCTYLIQGGANIKSVQYLARHKSERTTLKVYCCVDKEKAKEAHQKIMGKLK